MDTSYDGTLSTTASDHSDTQDLQQDGILLQEPAELMHQRLPEHRNTLSGASGQFLAEEMRKWLKKRSSLQTESVDSLTPINAWETVELKVATYYDRPFGACVNLVYDILQLSSGRDKFCALLQGYAKFASAALALPDSERHFTYRGVEDSLSDGRKIFRLFKEFREVYKVRRGFHRMQEGIASHGCVSIPAVCGTMDVLGHSASFFYYLFDNMLWAASVGLLRTKEIPKWQIGMWKGLRRDGKVISSLGGVNQVKDMKNMASIWRLNFAITANVLLLIAAMRDGASTLQGVDDPRIFHALELVGMAASYRVLLSKLKYVKLKSHATSGILAMVAALCGIWSNWRKVRRKKCGTKEFVTVAEKRMSQEKLRALSEENLSKHRFSATTEELQFDKSKK
jgi:hypothetical protein